MTEDFNGPADLISWMSLPVKPACVNLKGSVGWFPRLFWSLAQLCLLSVQLQAGDVKDVLASIGQVLAGDDDAAGNTEIRLEGSGVVISTEGIVVTNAHVVSE